MHIVIACDHAGVKLKEILIKYLHSMNHEVEDLGVHSDKVKADYPDQAQLLAEVMSNHPKYRGILICGSGVGMSMAANRYNHIRAALCYDTQSAELSRAHNNANVIALGARLINTEQAKNCVKAFLNTEFTYGRHKIRVDKLGKDQ